MARLSDEASLWLVPSTPVARVFFWIGAIEGRPGPTRLVVAASFSGIAGGSARARPGVRPPRLYLPDSGGRVVIVPGIRVRLRAAGGAF